MSGRAGTVGTITLATVGTITLATVGTITLSTVGTITLATVGTITLATVGTFTGKQGWALVRLASAAHRRARLCACSSQAGRRSNGGPSRTLP